MQQHNECSLVNPLSLLHSTELCVCVEQGWAPPATTHQQQNTVWDCFCYLPNLHALVSFINVIRAEGENKQQNPVHSGNSGKGRTEANTGEDF